MLELKDNKTLGIVMGSWSGLTPDAHLDNVFHNPIKYSLFIEKDGVFTQSIKLPGVSKEQIKVTVKENKFEVEVKEDTSFYLKGYKELHYLPKYGKFKELKAVMKDGVLTITVPKKNVEYNVKVD